MCWEHNKNRFFYFTLRFRVIHQKFAQVVESTKSAAKSDMDQKRQP